MCGIVGYIGDKKATPILIDGLLKLEYRGYDSSGISTIEDSNISLKKDIGRVKNLLELDGINDLKGTIGIAHTRWATHGKPSKTNSHPHMDNSKTFSVVHNGIIENYAELKTLLENDGYHFLSDTDTEIVPNLIHYYYKNSKNFLKSVSNACKMLNGSYALEIICKDYPDRIIVARKDSPLVIGHESNENFIASDIPAIVSYTKNFYFLDNGDLSEIYKDKLVFYDKDLNIVSKSQTSVDWSESSSTKNGYPDYMLKEIFEQPRAIKETIGHRLVKNMPIDFSDLELSQKFLSHINKIYIVACGTAMHAGLCAKPLFEKLCNILVTVEVASEFRYREPILDKNSLCIFISQSGETADTIAALKLAKSHNATTIAITNVIESSITREANLNLYTHAGPEIAVASTKAFTCQVTLLSLFAIHLAEVLNISNPIIDELKHDILSLSNKVKQTLEVSKEIETFAKDFEKAHDVFFIGRGNDFNVALEGSLKLKELSYIHSEAYAAGELKHGPIALIEKGVPVVGIITNSMLTSKTVSNLQEVITRGAKTLVITNQEICDNNFDELINIPEVHPMLSSIISIIPLQLFAYYIAKEKGLDVDKPRNLAKSVTVE